MALMTYRTTFALDKATAVRLKRLAARWRVSQAEVVRRALERAEAQDAPANAEPVERLRELHASGKGLDLEAADAYLDEVYEDRKHWRGR